MASRGDRLSKVNENEYAGPSILTRFVVNHHTQSTYTGEGKRTQCRAASSMNVPNALACSERKPHQKTSLPNTPAGNEQVRVMSVAATMSTMANVRCAVYSPRRHGRKATRAPHDGSLVDEGDGDGCDGGTLLTDAMWTTPIDHFNQTLDLQARQCFLITTNL